MSTRLKKSSTSSCMTDSSRRTRCWTWRGRKRRALWSSPLLCWMQGQEGSIESHQGPSAEWWSCLERSQTDCKSIRIVRKTRSLHYFYQIGAPWTFWLGCYWWGVGCTWPLSWGPCPQESAFLIFNYLYNSERYVTIATINPTSIIFITKLS